MSGVVSPITNNSAVIVGLDPLNLITLSLQTLLTVNPNGDSVSSVANSDAADAVVPTICTKMAGLAAPSLLVGDTQGSLATTNTATTNISNLMHSVDATLVDFSSSTLTSEQKSQYVAKIACQDVNMKSLIQGTSHIGNAVAGSTGTNPPPSSAAFTNARLTTTTAASGNTPGITSTSVSAMYNAHTGLSVLVDANIVTESARPRSLQARQQLATIALSIANQPPSLLTELS